MNPRFSLGTDGMIHDRGKPRFPITARHMPDGADFKALREFGFDAIRWSPFIAPGLTQEQSDPPSAEDLAATGACAYPAARACAVLRRRPLLRAGYRSGQANGDEG